MSGYISNGFGAKAAVSDQVLVSAFSFGKASWVYSISFFACSPAWPSQSHFKIFSIFSLSSFRQSSSRKSWGKLLSSACFSSVVIPANAPVAMLFGSIPKSSANAMVPKIRSLYPSFRTGSRPPLSVGSAKKRLAIRGRRSSA